MIKPWDSKGKGTSSSGRSGGCTARQARKLIAFGFVVWARTMNPEAPKGKVKKPTSRWLRDNISKEQASIILESLGAGSGGNSSSRKKEAERRRFMGVTHGSHFEHAMAIKEYNRQRGK